MQLNCIKMRYSIEPKDFLIVLKNEKKKSKKAIQKKGEATGDLIGKKIADEITGISKKSSAEHSMKLHSKDDAKSETEVPKKIHISRRKARNY